MLERVSFGRLKAVSDLLIGFAFGKEVIACAGIVLQMSEKDDLADKRLDSALSAQCDPRVPAEAIVKYNGSAPCDDLEVSGISHTILICNERGEMSLIVDILEESLFSAQEASDSLSPSGLDECLTRLEAWL